MGELKKFRNSEYMVSEEGHVYSLKSKSFLKETIIKFNYRRTHPHLDGKHVNMAVHRMVAEVFVPNPDNKPFALHLDNDPSNNHYTNLIWGTQSENIQQAYNEGRISAKGSNNGQSKLDDTTVKIIREARQAGFKVRHIAAYFKIGEGWAGRIANRKVWQHL